MKATKPGQSFAQVAIQWCESKTSHEKDEALRRAEQILDREAGLPRSIVPQRAGIAVIQETFRLRSGPQVWWTPNRNRSLV
jgi:hypothetical protein